MEIKQETKATSLKKQTPTSSSVEQIEYNAVTSVFSITFKKSMATYDYLGVTPEDALKAYNSPHYGSLATKELKEYKGIKREEK